MSCSPSTSGLATTGKTRNIKVIEVKGVRKTYGSTVAVDEVSFHVADGEIFGLIGPNGAGKTTTMECVEGLRSPDRGTISVLGLDPVRDVYKLQRRVGVQLQEAQLQKRIKVWEAVDCSNSSVSRGSGGATRGPRTSATSWLWRLCSWPAPRFRRRCSVGSRLE
jgi:ABC-type branched-subunit amino acid transport system ATPase component